MGIQELVAPFPWSRYSKKLAMRIMRPRWSGSFTERDAAERGMRLVIGRDGEMASGNCLTIYWLVDPEDGVVADAKYQLFGQSALIGAAEAGCELVVGKHYARAHRISADAIDRHLRDQEDRPSSPPEIYPHLNLVVGAIEMAAEMCAELGLGHGEALVTPQELVERGKEGSGFAGWEELSKAEKLEWIRRVVAEEIQPYIAMDAGEVEVIDLKENEVILSYGGSCTSCSSSTGSTLSAIQQILRSHLHPSLTAIPDTSI